MNKNIETDPNAHARLDASKKFNHVSLIVIGIFAMAFALYMITVPIYQIAYQLSELNKNLTHIERVEKQLKNLDGEFDKFNTKVDDSTLLSF